MSETNNLKHIENVKIENEPVIGDANNGCHRITFQIDHVWSNLSTYIMAGELGENNRPKIDFYKNLHKGDAVNIIIEKTTHFYNNEEINVCHIIDIEKINM